MNYLSNLDLPRVNLNKPQYNFSNDWDSVEVILNPIIREESLSSDSEIYFLFYFLFLKHSQLISKEDETLDVSDFPVKLSISDRKSIQEILIFIVERCLDTKYEYSILSKDNNLICFEIRFFFTHKNDVFYFPTALLEEVEYEIPMITFKFYPNKRSLADKNYLYPIWVLAKQSELVKQEI